MSFVFTDRESAYPNRYLLTRENGASEHIILERADEPVVVGTPLNAETFNALREDLLLNNGNYYDVDLTNAVTVQCNVADSQSFDITNTVDITGLMDAINAGQPVRIRFSDSFWPGRIVTAPLTDTYTGDFADDTVAYLCGVFYDLYTSYYSAIRLIVTCADEVYTVRLVYIPALGRMTGSTYTYGTEDLVDGESALATGSLYLVYE